MYCNWVALSKPAATAAVHHLSLCLWEIHTCRYAVVCVCVCVTRYSLDQWSPVENNHSVKEEARQEEVETGADQPGQLQGDREDEDVTVVWKMIGQSVDEMHSLQIMAYIMCVKNTERYLSQLVYNDY